MAGRGPVPKDPEKRERRNADAAPITELESGAVVDAPALPGAGGLREETRAWYATWASSPQAAQFLGTDWQRLHMTAKLVDAFYATDDAMAAKQLLAEIRLNEQKLGGTPEDRLRLRWRLRDVEREEDRAQKASARRPSRGRKDPRLQLVAGGES